MKTNTTLMKLVALALWTTSATAGTDTNCVSKTPACNPPPDQSDCDACTSTYQCTIQCTCPGSDHPLECLAVASAAELSCMASNCQ
jgi:hypothetical protein